MQEYFDPKRDEAAAACRNAQHELGDIAAKLSQLRNELSSLQDRWLLLDAEFRINAAADACRAAANDLYKRTEVRP